MAKTGPTFTTDEYSQPLITSFSRRSLRLYPASPRPTTFPPPPIVSCRYLKRRLPISPSPRETETDEEGKEENAVSRWSSPRAVISANVYDRANHVFHLPLFPL